MERLRQYLMELLGYIIVHVIPILLCMKINARLDGTVGQHEIVELEHSENNCLVI